MPSLQKYKIFEPKNEPPRKSLLPSTLRNLHQSHIHARERTLSALWDHFEEGKFCGGNFWGFGGGEGA